jgi:hypothetical protein
MMMMVGAAPVAPDKTSFVTINSSYITLHLTAWKSSSCPINNFVIQYKQQGSNEWILSSNAVNPALETTYTVSDLFSGTWYNLLIAAHSEAGSTEAEYLFATLTEAGATVSPLSVSVESDAAGIRFKKYIQMFFPVLSIFVAVVVILVLLLLVSFKKGTRGHMTGMHHFSELLLLISVSCPGLSICRTSLPVHSTQAPRLPSFCEAAYL